jgi:hypothetical protein
MRPTEPSFAFGSRVRWSLTFCEKEEMKFPKPLYYVKPPPDEQWAVLNGIVWFSTCGLSGDLTHEQAVTLATSPEWTDFVLERRNDITAHLAVHHRNRETEWNKVAVAYTQYCTDTILPKVMEAATTRHFGEDIAKATNLQVTHWMMEKTYASWGVPRFFDQLIDSLRAGRLPCGWDGEYPQGKLIEY